MPSWLASHVYILTAKCGIEYKQALWDLPITTGLQLCHAFYTTEGSDCYYTSGKKELKKLAENQTFAEIIYE